MLGQKFHSRCANMARSCSPAMHCESRSIFEKMVICHFAAVGRLAETLQSWPKKCVLGCAILLLCQQAESRNLGHTFFANSVFSFVV